MKPLKVGDSVTMPKFEFLSDGVIAEVVTYQFHPDVVGYVITLDDKAPNEYAYNTHTVFMFPIDVELVK
jgi:hypothetical protein